MRHLTHLITAGLLVATQQAHAQDNKPQAGWAVEPSLTQSFTYDSNPMRLSAGEKGIYGTTTAPQLTLRRSTPLSTIESQSLVTANFYNDSRYDSVDLSEKLLLSRMNQRWTANLRAHAIYDTTRVSELTNFSVHVPKVRSTDLGLGPELFFRSSERSTWGVTSSMNDVTYDNAAFVDYDFYRISPSYEYRVTPHHALNLTVNTQRYATKQGPEQISDSYGPSLGWTYEAGPKLTIRASAGALATNKHGAGASGDTSGWNYVFSGSAAYKGEQDHLNLTIARAREPFGNGTETLLDSIRFNDQHRLNQHLSLKSEAQYLAANYESIPGVNLDHSYQLGGGFSYRLTDDTELDANYRFRREKLTTISNDIDEHVAMFSINYTPNWSAN